METVILLKELIGNGLFCKRDNLRREHIANGVFCERDILQKGHNLCEGKFSSRGVLRMGHLYKGPFAKGTKTRFASGT